MLSIHEEVVTITKAQYKEMLKLIGDSEAYKNKHFKESRCGVPNDSICIGYEQASYGDWNYWITPEGEYVCTYYSIGD